MSSKSFMNVLSGFLFCCHFGISANFKGTFWQVTDLHWDKLYTRSGDPENMCHGHNVSYDNGYYGNIACDTNSVLYKSAVKAMYQLAPSTDFILWTGDNAPHIEYPNQTWTDVFETLTVTTSLLNDYFPTTPIFPILGNHDTIPSGQFPINNVDFYNAYLTNGNWSVFLTTENVSRTFQKGGYYSQPMANGIKIIVLNTCLYLQENMLVNETELDPGEQFAWMENELKESRRQQEKVIISSHVAPGYYATSARTLHMKPVFNDKLIELLANNSDILVTLIFGHEHVDTFRLLTDRNGHFTAGVFLAPPVTPWIPQFLHGRGSMNPGIRLYVYNTSSATIEDYFQFYMNYTEANQNASAGASCEKNSKHGSARDIPSSTCVCMNATATCAEWKLLYRPTQAYNLSDLSVNSMAQLYQRLVDSPELLEVFTNHSHLDYVIAPCNAKCRHNFICSFANITEQAMTDCFMKRDIYYLM